MSKNKTYFGIVAVTLMAGLVIALVLSFFSVKAAEESSPMMEICTPPGFSDPEGSILISYWPVDESAGATTFVDVISAHNGTCTGAACPTAGVTSIASTAVDFNASESDVIEVTSNTDFNFGASDNFSVGVWVKTTQNCSDTPDNKVFVGRYRIDDANNGTWWVGCVPKDGDAEIGMPAFHMRDSNLVVRRAVGNTQINDGDWHYLVGVRDGINDKNMIYVDGALETTLTAPAYTGTFAGDDNLTFGAYDLPGPGYYFHGILDEVTIYGRVLGDTEIEEYNNSCNPPPPNTPPTVGDVDFSTVMNTPLIITEAQLLANSSDADGDSLSVNSVDATSTQGGTITGAVPGPFTYTPPTDFTGDDSFKFSVFDGTDSTQGTANIQVKEPDLYLYLPIILK